jgi:hypothetical protein
MELDRGKDGKSGGSREKHPRKFQKTVQEGDERTRPESRKSLPEEESVRLFVSAGRSRRVLPRDILGLITARTSVSKDDIGVIRILDNYSFIQARTTVADEIIEALNGKPFRGRSLVVNYARNRKDEAPAGKPEGEETDNSGFSFDAETGDEGYGEEEYAGEARVDEFSVQENDDHSDKEGI